MDERTEICPNCEAFDLAAVKGDIALDGGTYEQRSRKLRELVRIALCEPCEEDEG